MREMEDFRKTLVACYNQDCMYNTKCDPEPTCSLKLILIEGGVCKSQKGVK